MPDKTIYNLGVEETPEETWQPRGSKVNQKKPIAGSASKRSRILAREEVLIASSFHKKPDEMCKPMQNVFSAVDEAIREITMDEITVEELKLLRTRISLIIKNKIDALKAREPQTKSKKIFKRSFYQVKDKKGNYFWYVRQRVDGKLDKLTYFGVRLPKINRTTDKVSFHPQYIADHHKEWIELKAVL